MLTEEQKLDLREKAKDIYVSGDFLLSIMDRIDHADEERDKTIDKLSTSITDLRDGLMGVINALNATLSSVTGTCNTMWPTRKDIYDELVLFKDRLLIDEPGKKGALVTSKTEIIDEITDFREKLLIDEPGKKGVLVKFIEDVTGKEGGLTKINEWVSRAVWAVGIIASVTTIITSIVVNLLPKIIK